MNIHPIFVHFPIAFLTVYAVAELIRSKRVLDLVWWKNVKMVLLLVGSVGTFFALGTGEFGEKEFAFARATISVHENFADVTTAIFAALAIFYIVSAINEKWGALLATKSNARVWGVFMKIITTIFKTPVVVSLAFAGLVAVTITGALGGAIVYGPNADPVIHFIYSLFF